MELLVKLHIRFCMKIVGLVGTLYELIANTSDDEISFCKCFNWIQACMAYSCMYETTSHIVHKSLHGNYSVDSKKLWDKSSYLFVISCLFMKLSWVNMASTEGCDWLMEAVTRTWLFGGVRMQCTLIEHWQQHCNINSPMLYDTMAQEDRYQFLDGMNCFMIEEDKSSETSL